MRRTVLYSGFIGRLVVMTVSASLAIVILSATGFAQGNASQDQYTNESTQSDPSTAPATDAPGPDSTAPASPDASQKSPTPDSTAPATDPPTSEPTTAPATETPAPDSTAPGTETPAPDSTAPSAPNASQECPWEPIQPGEIQGFSGCPWHRELPGGSQDLGNGQCYDTHLGVTYSCSGESQTPNPGGPGGQTPNPGHPGIQTPNPLDPGIQTPNPGSAGGSNSGGSNIIRQIESFLGSILTGGNLQKQGPHDQQKYGSIRPIIDLLNPMNVGLITGVVDLLNPLIGVLQGDSAKIDETGGLLTRIADLLRPIIGAGQGGSAKIDETGQNKGDKVEPVGRGPVDASYCKQFPNDSRCQGGDQTNTGALPDEFKEAQDAQVGCMLAFAPHVGGGADIVYTSIHSQHPYKAVQLGVPEVLKHAEKLNDIEVLIKHGVTPEALKSIATAGNVASIAMSIPDCIKFGKDSGLIGEYGLTKDLGINKLTEMLGISPDPSDTSKGGGIILSCNQFPGQSVDEIQKNCQEVNQNQSGP